MIYKKYDIAGSVILYNSDLQVVKNINSYLPQIDHLFIIDNSEVINNELIKQLESINNITYVCNNDNLGVAYALNQAANMAIGAGYKFLLTMDDDTYFPIIGVQKMLDYINQKGIKQLGILASQSNPRLVDSSIKQVQYTITSGSLLNLSAYKECGPFMNELFIDFVDHEYCFRLESYGYNIIEMNSIILDHNLGQRKQLSFLGYKSSVYWTSHSPLRIYYKTRNCVFSFRKYKSIKTEVKYIFYKEMCKDFLKIMFLENKKKKRFILFVKGVSNGLTGSLGKINLEI